MWFGMEACLPIAALLLGLVLLVLLARLLRGLRAASVKEDRRKGLGLKVVVTGSSRGLGFALARQFVELGDEVVITSRTQHSADAAARRLLAEFPGGRVVGLACDVSKPGDVDSLAATAVRELGQIDLWVNNAAQSASAKVDIWETPAEELVGIVGANLGGALLGARAAISRMRAQSGGGKVFLVDGSGSRGNPTPGNAAYGATKAALVQLARSLAQEMQGSNVAVHICSPGMVTTDLLLRYATNPRSAKFINILAEEPAVVAAWLVPRMRGVRGNGTYFCYLTPLGVAWRFLTARRRRGRFVPEGDGSGGGTDGYQRLRD